MFFEEYLSNFARRTAALGINTFCYMLLYAQINVFYTATLSALITI
jgi:hypothetical protein